MVSSGEVNKHLSELQNNLYSYKSFISSFADNWRGLLLIVLVQNVIILLLNLAELWRIK